MLKNEKEKMKTKVRFTSLDITAMVSDLQSLVGMRATNIYDLSPLIYLFKLAKSEDKQYLLIENGVRFHTISDPPNKKNIPSGFTMKFRKFLRSKRLESIRQVGVERVVVFTFGSETFCNHLILELYSQGNVILTDANYRILQCIRSHEFNEQVRTAVGEIYPFEFAANLYIENIDVSNEKAERVLKQQPVEDVTVKKAEVKIEPVTEEKDEQQSDKKGKKQTDKNQKGQAKKEQHKKQAKGKGKQLKLKDCVFKLVPCLFPLAIDHILTTNELNPEAKVDITSIEQVAQGGRLCLEFLKTFMKSKHKGYVYIKSKAKKAQKEVQEKEGTKNEPQVEYFEYQPFQHIKFAKIECVQFGTFNQAACEYYSKYEKMQHEQEEGLEDIAWKKYEQIKRDQEERMKKLQEEQDIFRIKAEFIEQNVQDVDAIVKIVKTMEDNGYSWEDIERMVGESKKSGDPLANMIHSLNIFRRQVTVLLGESGTDSQLCSLLPVQINIDYNAFTNATLYYEGKRKQANKEKRTMEASEQVLKVAEKEALRKIEKKRTEALGQNIPARKPFWFEKFYWFISSEGYLVISGRDSHMNELLVKRYMKSGDLYMHSDYGGAASTVIKRPLKGLPVPRATLEEAAVFTICRSKAWDTKILSGAWWVYDDQVSKSAPTGQFLPTGSFMIRGKRNFLQPNRMEMGLTLLFRIDAESAQRHMNDRRIHEEEEKLLEEDFLRKQSSHEGQEEEFAIVSVDPDEGKPRDKKRGKQKGKTSQEPQVAVQKQEQVKEKEKDSSASSSEGDSQEEKQPAKKEVKNTSKKQTPTVPHQKHKVRNEKKLKKLQKYLQQQDNQEREIIMKMLGAKQMKHMKGDQPEEPTVKVDRKKKKRGLEKYFATTEEVDQKPNTDKVLFLKTKTPQEIEAERIQMEEEETRNRQEEQRLLAGQKNQAEDNEGEEDSEEGEEQTKQVKEEPKEEQVDEKVLDSQLLELNRLVGKIHPLDKYENLITMCAPYSTIKENQFKVKLVPGGLKKGKAARNIVNYFMTEAEDHEKPFVKAVPEQELINAVIGNVKLAGAGLLKIDLKNKADKKVKRKQNDQKKE